LESRHGVSNQNVIQLEIALKHASRPPDLVLFYDGLADALAAYLNGNADGHFALENIASRVEGGRNKHSSFSYLRETATWRLIGVLMKQAATWNASSAAGVKPPHKFDKLDQMTVENYRANMKIVDALSAKYGFQYISFWERTILAGDKPLSGPERQMLQQINRTIYLDWRTCAEEPMVGCSRYEILMSSI
jgi:hypothetical protein